MSDIGAQAAPLVLGLLLGAFFFGGLWWTVRRGLETAHPAAWFAISAFLRMAVLLVAFYGMAHTGWANVLVCLLGLLIARAAITRLTRSAS